MKKLFTKKTLFTLIIFIGVAIILGEIAGNSGTKKAIETKKRIEGQLTLMAEACWNKDSITVKYIKFISLDSGKVLFNFSKDTMVFSLDEKLRPTNNPNVNSIKVNEPCQTFNKYNHGRSGNNLSLL